MFTHHGGKGLFSCGYLRMTFLVGPIDKGFVAHPTRIRFFSGAHFLVTFLVSTVYKGLVVHPAGFSLVCFFA